MPPKPLPKRPFCSPTLTVLKKQAAARKIAGRSKMSKAELCKALGYRTEGAKKVVVRKPASVKAPPRVKPPSGCDRQTAKKYVSRSSPPYPANQCCGRVMKGNDGRQYISKPDKRGVCRWYEHRESKPVTVPKAHPKPVAVSKAPKTTALYESKRYCEQAKGDLLKESSCVANWPSSRTLTHAQLLYYASLTDSGVKMSDRDTKKLCEIVQRAAPSKKLIAATNTYLKSDAERNDLVSGYTKNGDRIVNMVLSGKVDKAIETLREMNSNYNFLFSKTLGKHLTPKDVVDMKELVEIYDSPAGVISYLQDEFMVPYVTQSYTKRALTKYLPDAFDKMIRGAPTLEKDIVVYRGLSTMKHLTPGTVYTSTQIMSTSVDIQVAIAFSNYKYLMQIIIPKGTPCLILPFGAFGTSEDEVLLPVGTKILYSGCNKRTINHLENPADFTAKKDGRCYKQPTITMCEGSVVR